jgi:heat shock protein HtpX
VHEQIAANKRKTVLLFVLAIAFTGLIGYAIGYLFFAGGTAGVVIAVALAAILSLSSYFAGDRLVLASTRAREVTSAEEPRLHNVVEGLAIAAGIPKPRVYVVPEQAPNAFATGRNPEHSSVAVTQGLLDSMNRVELEGVIGHEMSHVLDRDILIGTVVATVVGAAVLMSEFFMRSWFWSGGRMGGRRDGGGDAGVITFVLFAVGIVLLILAPIAGQLIKLSVSRNREYLADAEGVLLTRYPPGLISALEKIRDAPHAMRAANNATAHLWLDQPSRVPGEGTSTMEKLFSTHPPIQERIDRLRDM